MFVLRATQRLLVRAKPTLESEPAESTTKLGDWCANLVRVGRRQLVLAISSRTFFPVVVEAAPISQLALRIRDAAGSGLLGLGIRPDLIDEELDRMHDVVWARSASRKATGILVDFAKALPFTWRTDRRSAPRRRSSRVRRSTPCLLRRRTRRRSLCLPRIAVRPIA